MAVEGWWPQACKGAIPRVQGARDDIAYVRDMAATGNPQPPADSHGPETRHATRNSVHLESMGIHTRGLWVGTRLPALSSPRLGSVPRPATPRYAPPRPATPQHATPPQPHSVTALPEANISIPLTIIPIELRIGHRSHRRPPTRALNQRAWRQVSGAKRREGEESTQKIPKTSASREVPTLEQQTRKHSDSAVHARRENPRPRPSSSTISHPLPTKRVIKKRTEGKLVGLPSYPASTALAGQHNTLNVLALS